MWSDLRRWFTRTAPQAPPPDRPRGGVGVVDGTAVGLGSPVREALVDAGLPAVNAGPYDLQLGYDCLVVILPLTSPALPRAQRTPLPLHGDETVAALVALDANFTSRLVVVWHVGRAARMVLAAPRVFRDHILTDAWNAADLLVGASWQRDLRRHAGDADVTLRCRSGRLARTAALTGAPLGDTSVADFCRAVAILDPGVLHTAVPDLAGEPLRRAGAAALVAAVRLRNIPFGGSAG